MTKRTLHFRIAHCRRPEGSLYQVQGCWSDGVIEPIADPVSTLEECHDLVDRIEEEAYRTLNIVVVSVPFSEVKAVEKLH